MKYDGRNGIKRKIASFFKYFFYLIYFSSTVSIPVYVFYYVYSLKSSFIYAITISFVFLIGMDIVCSILEDVAEKVYELAVEAQRKNELRKEQIQKQKEEEIKELEKILQEKTDYVKEINEAKERNDAFKKQIKKCIGVLPKDIEKNLSKICDKIDEIIKILEEDTNEYYHIRHTFKIFFPKFEEMSYRFINITKGGNLEEQNISEFIRLINKFNQYLDSIKGRINASDKLSLNVDIASLVKTMEAEIKKGEK